MLAGLHASANTHCSGCTLSPDCLCTASKKQAHVWRKENPDRYVSMAVKTPGNPAQQAQNRMTGQWTGQQTTLPPRHGQPEGRNPRPRITKCQNCSEHNTISTHIHILVIQEPHRVDLVVKTCTLNVRSNPQKRNNKAKTGKQWNNKQRWKQLWKMNARIPGQSSRWNKTKKMPRNHDPQYL